MLGVQGKYHMYCMMTKSFSFIDQLTTTERAQCWGFYRFGDVHACRIQDLLQTQDYQLRNR